MFRLSIKRNNHETEPKQIPNRANEQKLGACQGKIYPQVPAVLRSVETVSKLSKTCLIKLSSIWITGFEAPTGRNLSAWGEATEGSESPKI